MHRYASKEYTDKVSRDRLQKEVRAYMCMYVCMYVCVYIHTHTYTRTPALARLRPSKAEALDVYLVLLLLMVFSLACLVCARALPSKQDRPSKAEALNTFQQMIVYTDSVAKNNNASLQSN